METTREAGLGLRKSGTPPGSPVRIWTRDAADDRAHRQLEAIPGTRHTQARARRHVPRQRWIAGLIGIGLGFGVPFVLSVVLIATSGERIGQVNGLSVYQAGGERFGAPIRITATSRA